MSFFIILFKMSRIYIFTRIVYYTEKGNQSDQEIGGSSMQGEAKLFEAF